MTSFLIHLLAFLGFSFIVLTVAVPAFLLVRQLRRARRANQVTPGRATHAPLRWLWLPTPAALLHRRLRASVAAARFAVVDCGPQPLTPLSDSLDELASVAAHLDDGVVAAARLPRGARMRALRELTREVSTVEQTADRLVATASRFTGDASNTPTARLAAVQERLRAIDLAVEEVRAIHENEAVF
jgi:hypothetical protein